MHLVNIDTGSFYSFYYTYSPFLYIKPYIDLVPFEPYRVRPLQRCCNCIVRCTYRIWLFFTFLLEICRSVTMVQQASTFVSINKFPLPKQTTTHHPPNNFEFSLFSFYVHLLHIPFLFLFDLLY